MGPVKTDDKEILTYLREHKVKPSLIRIKVLQYLVESKSHPNVDMIYRALEKNIPTLSKTSIYNSLKIFVKEGVVKEVTIEENEVRYDATTERHGHFKCIECGSLTDINLECESCSFKGLKGGKVLDEHIYLRGICSDCLKKGGVKKV